MSGFEQVKVKSFALLDYSHSSVSSLLDVISELWVVRDINCSIFSVQFALIFSGMCLWRPPCRIHYMYVRMFM